MIPFLTYPLALLALATLPTLAAIYILRNRFKRRQVSSLLLWRFQVQSKSGGAKVHRLQLPLLFFLELLALALLVIAAAGPHWQLPQSTRPLIVVLDDSFSLRATRDGVSAQTRAQEFLEKMFRHQPPPTTRLILAGMEPRSLGATMKTWREVAALLPQWQCGSPSAALDAALTLASEMGRQQANILVLTDHPPTDEKISNPRLEWHSFGAATENFAIVNASRTAFGEQDRCLLEVANFSGGARPTTLLVQAGSNAPQSSALLLSARETKRIVFNLPAAAPALHAWLAADSLIQDNDVQLLPPIRKRVRVQVALGDENLSALANRTLEATGLRTTISENPELVISETDALVGQASSLSSSPAGGKSPNTTGKMPVPLANSNAWSLCWSSGGTNAFTGPFVVDQAHPLAEGIGLEGIIWAGTTTTNAPGDVPVILTGNTPLLSAREDALGRRHLNLNFNPALSTLQNTPGWPIIFWNILQWRIAEMPGLSENNARLGTEVILKTTGEAVTITQPDGAVKSFPKTGGELAIATPLAGRYAVAVGTSTNWLAVNTLAADESDLSACVTGQWGKWGEDTEHRLAEASAVWIFGLLALALLMAHLWLIASGKGAK